MNRCRAVVLLGVALLLAAPAFAQEPPPGVPPVLRISIEDIKPGSMGAHEKQVASYLALWERAKAPTYRLGLTPVSGDNNRVVYLEGFPSYAEMESVDKRIEEAVGSNPAWQAELDQLERQTGPMHASQKTMIATFRADLSYQPLKMDGVAKARYFNMTTSRLRPGRGADYVEYVKQLNRAREKAQVADIHTAVYQVTTGAPAGTYVTFALARSLADFDAFQKASEARNRAIDEALGGESVVRQRAERAEQIFDSGSGVSALYSVNRKISRPEPQFASYDAEYWTPKPAAKALAVKKEEKK
jgi:hypothetical protein